jgi:hypothetical protein
MEGRPKQKGNRFFENRGLYRFSIILRLGIAYFFIEEIPADRSFIIPFYMLRYSDYINKQKKTITR